MAINKIQTEKIKLFEHKEEAIKDLYNPHEYANEEARTVVLYANFISFIFIWFFQTCR